MAELVPAGVEYGPDPEAARQTIQMRLNWGRQFWKPWHDRQDYWYAMYKLLDPVQQLKPMNYRRYTSNDPRTAIDAAISISVRNEPFWRIDMPYGMLREEREQVGKIERALAGIVDDLDMMFLERGDGGGNFWNQAAFFAYQRGGIWGKFQVTTEAVRMGRKSPLLGEFWDPRFVYPNFDGIGLESVVVEKHTTLNELFNQYGPAIQASVNGRGLNISKLDPNAPAVKCEYWSNGRNGGAGWYGVLGYYATDSNIDYAGMEQAPAGNLWLIPPAYHQYAPEALPVIGVPVNGVPIRHAPAYGAQLTQALNARALRTGMQSAGWYDPRGWVSDWGRGLLSAVEEANSQYNELMATIFQHLTLTAYPTYVFNTQTGDLPDFQGGVNSRVPLRIGESVNVLEGRPTNIDAYKLAEIVREEKQRGTLNSILQANGGLSASSGVVLQQNINAALNNLEPYTRGLVNFGSLFGSHMLEQLRVAKAGPLSLVARGSRSYFRIEFDPATDLEDRKYKPIPIFRPAIPEDLLLKAQVARLLLDPRAPLMSIVTVLDRIFQLEDPEGELRRMDEDVAARDPVILLERVASILEEEGEPQMAERIRQREFQAKFQAEAELASLQAQVAQIRAQMGIGSGGGQDAGAGADGLSAQTGAASATGAGQPAPGQGGSAMPGGDMSAMGMMGGV